MNKATIFRISGIAGIVGALSVVVADVIGIILHEEHDPISDTISMLAIGKYGWIQDTGLDIFAAGILMLAIGLFVWKANGLRWILALIMMLLLAADLVLIAEHNQYAGRPGESIHIYLVYALGGLFLLTSGLLGFEMKLFDPLLKRISLTIAVLWLILSPLFFIVPDNLDGAYERFISLIMITWVCVVGYYLYNTRGSTATLKC